MLYSYDKLFRGHWRRCMAAGQSRAQADDAIVEKYGHACIIRRADTLEIIWNRGHKPPRCGGSRS